MALTHLLDTSVVSRLGRPEVRVVIEPLAHAAAAEQAELILLHYDNYFELIAEVTGQTCRWDVPAGAID